MHEIFLYAYLKPLKCAIKKIHYSAQVTKESTDD